MTSRTGSDIVNTTGLLDHLGGTIAGQTLPADLVDPDH
ncbi:hypothetical Protein YC6258_01798 [Gynuella sunshinyii YC6258]|uniref:Uncharacterized protein n=1 Tax=Gynuella sunshinyii YC6258 TaxID=1445510 RepID=A0A0C5VGW5_9GAMM|nr:hypothetical Protein YC6258_01798 [Gynuella sunshinyii YC6258]